MQYSGIPTKTPTVFGSNAGTNYINVVPVASQIATNPGFASFTDGFVPLNDTPISAGGIPPRIKDINGAFNSLSAWSQWYQAGGAITYDSTFQSAVGGYPKGAIVLSTVTAGLYWRSTADNNTTNPDSGGAGWVSAYAGRLLNVQIFAASGTYTPTAGTNSIEVELQGAGGASGGAPATGTNQTSAGAGGGAGAWAWNRIVGSITSQTVTVGAGGTGNSGAYGNAGQASSFGSIVSANGGGGGSVAGPSSSTGFFAVGGAGGAAGSSGTRNAAGLPGSPLGVFNSSGLAVAPVPGSTPGAGGGGQGFANGQNQAAVVGNYGQAGIVIIREYS